MSEKDLAVEKVTDAPGAAIAAAQAPQGVARRLRWLAYLGWSKLTLRRLLWASLALVPVAVLAAVAGMDDVPVFLLSVAALVPLAWLIGEATEQVGEYTGPAIAGLLNASFGNAPEMIIALFAVENGLFEVVRGSLSGSVISNLLLVLGFSLVVGGKGRIARRSAYAALGMVALAGLLFALPELVGGPAAHERLTAIGIGVAAVLLAIYLVLTAWSVVKEAREQRASGSSGEADWSLRRALLALGLATLATVAVSEVLVGSIEAFTRASGLSELFCSAVIVAIAGNAAEHGGAVVIAARGGVRLASEIALQSSAQVALGVIPAVILLSLVISPMPLFFSGVEYLGLAIAVAVPALFLLRGRTARWQGAGMLAAYAAIVAVFYAVM
ncbi:calcium/proton exchanger [Pseudonocardia eucalypti]|uniref:Calcium/proton exchanger n=1 Tax=Pseudonocardia eucalypti TaxID=648755 RepID=A0ABP9Q1V7_9PSEU